MQRQKNKPQQQHLNVVPFTGELYPQAPPPQAGDKAASMLFFFVAALVAGLSLGAIAVYQSSDQSQLRQLKADQERLNEIKSNVCN